MTEDAKKHRDELAEKYAKQFEACGPTDMGRRCRSYISGFDAGYAYRFEEYSKLDDINIRLNERIKELEARSEKYKKALEFYSKGSPVIGFDYGDTARAALKEQTEPEHCEYSGKKIEP